MSIRRFSFVTILWAWLMMAFALSAQDANNVDALYLKIKRAHPPTLSGLDPYPEDLGQAGALLAVKDIATTGQFMGYGFSLDEIVLDEGDVAGARKALSESKADYVLLDMSAEAMGEVIEPNAQKLYFNVSAYDDELRGAGCLPRLFHTIPSYAMRADAMMQFLRARRWTHPVLLIGHEPEDERFAESLRRSAAKFQIEFNVEKSWAIDEDLRRSAADEVPLLTQEFGDYHVMIVADERNDFARYLAYNTWNPRPIMGGDGLRAVGWSRVMEQWGAVQLQERFTALAGRDMRAEDYAAWAAMRAVDEAYLRTKFGALEAVNAYLRGDEFELAGFKGRPLSFRSWNGQMRQPIPLVTATAVVRVAPLEGYLHEKNELDTLGMDEPENQCQAFGE